MHILPWNVDSVVTLKGSFRTSPDFQKGDELIQDLLVSMLDKGTALRSKLAVAEALEDRGASIRFQSAGIRIRFEIKCLKPDLGDVVQLLIEQLNQPLFNVDEFELLKGRLQASVERMRSDTSSLSSSILSRHVYDADHPARALPLEELERSLENMELAALSSLHERQFGASDFECAVVGDIAGVNLDALFTQLCSGWSSQDNDDAIFKVLPLPQKRETRHVEVADRLNLDVRMGHGVDLLKTHPDYLPLFISIFALGGNFSSHLMSTIRDRDGLTYGIRSSLSGVSKDYPGMWSTSVTLSQENLERGVGATLSEIEHFLGSGIDQSELDEKKSTLTGAYQVQLSSTSGVASTLLSNAENGHVSERIDTYPDEVLEISLEQANRAMARHLDASSLTIVSAGTKEA
jgi:zinc protease